MRRRLVLLAVMAITIGACTASGTETTELDESPETTHETSMTSMMPATAATPELGPYDLEATIQPEVVDIEPAHVQAGDLASVFFPDESLRGIHFVLESRSGNSWNLEYHLVSDWGDGSNTPMAYKVGSIGEDISIPDVGIGGPGPDAVLIPVDATPGEYRVCTGNASPNVCALVTVESAP
jgi:hypothetical protein